MVLLRQLFLVVWQLKVTVFFLEINIMLILLILVYYDEILSYMDTKIKAYTFTIFFSVIGGIMICKNLSLVTLPLILFYIVLIVNSYFSVEFFSKIIPAKRFDQKIIDLFLVFLYLVLILNISNEIWYLLSAIMLFVVATLKYVFLLGMVDVKILKKKMIIDIFGIIACVLALVGYLAGGRMAATWIWALVFLFANIYLLVINPMYKFKGVKN